MRPCFAKIFYEVSVKMGGSDMSPQNIHCKSSIELYINGQFDKKISRRKYKTRANLKTCCLSHGKIYFESHIEKDQYRLGEQIKMIVNIENNAFRTIKRFELSCIQVLSLRTFRTSVVKKDSLMTKHFSGIKRLKKNVKENARVFEMYLDNMTLTGGGFSKMGFATNTTTHGFLIDCDYFLEVRAIPNVCCMCCLCFHSDPKFSNPFFLYSPKPFTGTGFNKATMVSQEYFFSQCTVKINLGNIEVKYWIRIYQSF
jgi:hypothetical protein